MTVNLERVRNNLLDLASQDYVGLYEIVWDCNEEGSEVLPEAERITAARALVNELLEIHEGRLFKTSAWPPEKWEELKREDWPSVITSDESFRIPADSSDASLYWVALDD